MFGRNLLKSLATAAVFAVMAGGAQAATVLTVDDTYPGLTPLNGTLTCVQTCEGLVDTTPTTWATDGALLFTVHPPSDAIELAFVNGVTGGGFVTGTKTDTTGDPYSFTTDALYILMKIGGGNEFATFLIKNTFGAGLQISWDAVSGEGAGLSHYTTFGTAAVPVPAAGLLLLGALGGLAALRRRRAV